MGTDGLWVFNFWNFKIIKICLTTLKWPRFKARATINQVISQSIDRKLIYLIFIRLEKAILNLFMHPFSPTPYPFQGNFKS